MLQTRLTYNINAKSDTYVNIGSTVGVHHPTTVYSEDRGPIPHRCIFYDRPEPRSFAVAERCISGSTERCQG